MHMLFSCDFWNIVTWFLWSCLEDFFVANIKLNVICLGLENKLLMSHKLSRASFFSLFRFYFLFLNFPIWTCNFIMEKITPPPGPSNATFSLSFEFCCLLIAPTLCSNRRLVFSLWALFMTDFINSPWSGVFPMQSYWLGVFGCFLLASPTSFVNFY